MFRPPNCSNLPGCAEPGPTGAPLEQPCAACIAARWALSLDPARRGTDAPAPPAQPRKKRDGRTREAKQATRTRREKERERARVNLARWNDARRAKRQLQRTARIVSLLQARVEARAKYLTSSTPPPPMPEGDEARDEYDEK